MKISSCSLSRLEMLVSATAILLRCRHGHVRSEGKEDISKYKAPDPDAIAAGCCNLVGFTWVICNIADSLLMDCIILCLVVPSVPNCHASTLKSKRKEI